MKSLLMPALGVAMTEGLLLRWLRSSGDLVAAGEPIVEIETDKSIMEIESPAAGVVGPLLFEPGAVVPVGVAITHIVEADDAADAATTLPDGASAPVGGEPGIPDVRTAATPASGASASVERVPHRLSPRERRLARESAGTTGASQEAEPATALPATTAAGAPTTAVPAAPAARGRHRELIATKVSESWRTIPHFAVTREVDAAAMAAVREGHRNEQPGFTSLMVKALALALRERGEPGAVDVGLAVATPQGVAIPVIRGVLALDLDGLQRETQAAISRAREGRLRQADLAEPPRSTLSNLGPQGIDSFTGVVAVGQTSLLTVGRIMTRPYAADGSVSVRNSFIATLNVDHRVLDGDDAASLLMAFVAAAEDAERLEGQGIPA